MVGTVGIVRGVLALVGAGLAGLLVWVSTRIGDHSTGGYWAVSGILAGAGLTMALSRLFGGRTEWGVPRVSAGVFLIGFLPVLVCAGWVLLAAQPHANWFQGHVAAWSGHAGIRGPVRGLGEHAAVLAFGLGLVFGLMRARAASTPAQPSVSPRPAQLERERQPVA